ncbi:MAG: D-alanine--D-alanine ligase, partial [Ottowia sp.]|nr:D-alanine--D-alanine ligase [Ottowia sp.]
VVAPEGNYDYKNKYFSDETRYICPADIDADLEQRTRALSLAAFHAVGCRGWARADLMQCKRDGVVYLLEINTSPGMTGHSLVPMAAKAVGIDYANLVLRILAGAQLELRANQYWKPDLL